MTQKSKNAESNPVGFTARPNEGLKSCIGLRGVFPALEPGCVDSCKVVDRGVSRLVRKIWLVGN